MQSSENTTLGIAELTALDPRLSVAEPPIDFSSPEINQVRSRDRAVHDWYRFVLSFPPHLVQDYLTRFGIDPDRHCVLDPFCGTGTTVVECKKRGIASVGVEANPMAWFAGSVKSDWSPDPEALLEAAERIGEATERTIVQTGDNWRVLSDESEALLLKHSRDKTSSISPQPLHKTLILIDHIRAAESACTQHLLLATAKAIVTTIGNVQFRPEVSVTRAKLDAPVVEAWLEQVRMMAQDLETLQALKDAPATMHRADSRQIVQTLAARSIDGVITSPPYPNEKDYTRTTRLESVLLGFIRNKGELRRLKEGLVRSNTRNVFKCDADDIWVAKHPEIQRLAAEIEARRLALGKTSGFERLYHRAVKLYFGGMAKHLADLRYVLRPGAQLAYVVGDQKSYLKVLIRTGQLLGEIAEGLGYELVSIDLFRTRMATAIREQIREEVVVLRWSGKMPDSPYPFSDYPL